MRILYNAVEGKERTIAGGDRIIITYNKETSTGGWVASLCRWESELQSFGVFSEPEIVGPDRAQSFTQRCFNLPIFWSATYGVYR